MPALPGVRRGPAGDLCADVAAPRCRDAWSIWSTNLFIWQAGASLDPGAANGNLRLDIQSRNLGVEDCVQPAARPALAHGLRSGFTPEIRSLISAARCPIDSRCINQ